MCRSEPGSSSGSVMRSGGFGGGGGGGNDDRRERLRKRDKTKIRPGRRKRKAG